MCGENVVAETKKFKRAGSSPRVRGKLIRLRPAPTPEWLIPACAGKTFVVFDVCAVVWAHPRVCGENANDVCERGDDTGSSPRVRGKLIETAEGAALVGLIPACAGKTWPLVASEWAVRAHPRVCGENGLIFWGLKLLKGSSPRVRGKRS